MQDFVHQQYPQLERHAAGVERDSSQGKSWSLKVKMLSWVLEYHT